MPQRVPSGASTAVGVTTNRFTRTKVRLSQKDIDLMLDANSIRKPNPGEKPAADCDFFSVPEWAKLRRRRVVNPKPVNERFGRDTLEPLNLPSRTSFLCFGKTIFD